MNSSEKQERMMIANVVKKEKIEITARMIEAGLDELYAWQAHECFGVECIRAVYAAMERARVRTVCKDRQASLSRRRSSTQSGAIRRV